jgi:hypothetical protein
MHIAGGDRKRCQHFVELWRLGVPCSICYWYTHGQVGLWSHGQVGLWSHGHWNTRCFCGILCEEKDFLQFLVSGYHTVRRTDSHFHS